MATARAIANGNWSATSTWNGGVLPGNGDTVYANGFNVTINQDINIGGANNPTVNAGSFVSGQWYEVLFVGTTNFTLIGAASNTAGTIFLATGAGTGTGTARALATLTTAANTPAGATGGGGSFAMSTPYAITTDLRAGTTACLSVTGATALTLDGLRVIGGSAVSAHGCNYSGTTTCTLANGTFTGGTSNGHALNNASTGTVNVSASCTFTAGGNANALNNASTGTVNVSASCTFTGGGSNTNTLNNASTGAVNITASCAFTGGFGASGFSIALNNALTGSVNVSAPCTFTGGSTINSSGLHNLSTGTVIVTQSTFTASAFANAVSSASTTADVRLSGDFLDHWTGWKAVNSPRFRLGTAPTLGQTRYALAGTTDSYFTMFGSDFGTFGNPIAANVRSGIVYGGGNLTGTCAVPAAGSVALGVPVDAGFGTAVLTPAAIRSELATELGRIDADISSRLAPSGTLAVVTTLTNAPTVPSAASIAAATRTELAVELARVDASISSRLAPSGTLATVTNLTNAPASVTPSDIWSHATRTITGGTVDTLTNSPSVPSAASIAAATRTELAVELARVDASISSRLAGSAYTAPANSDVAAIKAKTDNLPASPAATGDIPSANISAIKAKTDLLNTDRLAQCSTVSTTGAQLAAALS